MKCEGITGSNDDWLGLGLDANPFVLCVDRIQAEGIPGAAGHRHHGESGEPQERGGGSGGGDQRRGVHLQPEVLQRVEQRHGHRLGEYRLLQGRDALLCHDGQEALAP